MHLENRGSELIVTGNIKSIEDSLSIKQVLAPLVARGEKNLQLTILDSFSMTSTVIGYLINLVSQHEVRVTTQVGDARLYELLEELSLVQTLNVRLS